MNNRDDLAMRVEQVREDYGDELFDTVLEEADRRAQERAQQQMQQMQQSLSTVQQDSFATKKALLAQRLAGQSINFEQVNNDPVFHDWLRVYDQQTGVQRQTRLSQAFESGDLNSVSSMFVEFVNGGGQSQPSLSFGQQSNMSREELLHKHNQLLRLRNRAESRNDDATYDDLTRQMDEVTRMMMQ